MVKNIMRFVARIISGHLMPRLAYPVFCGPLKGARFILGSLAGEGGGATVYFNGIEKQQTKIFQDTLKPGNVLFDIGANVGYYTLLGSKLVGKEGRVVSFEPVVQNLSYLERHVRLNKMKNVLIVPVACADSISLAKLCSGVNCATGHLEDISLEAGVSQIDDGMYVAAVTVDNFVEKSGLMPNVIKIDVEGAEMRVLAGAVKTITSAKPKICLSIHSSQLRTDCLDFMRKNGYSVSPLDGNMDDATEYLACVN